MCNTTSDKSAGADQMVEDCPICGEDMKVNDPGDSWKLSCNHQFHSSCILTWIQSTINDSKYTQTTCPVCRDTILNLRALELHEPDELSDLDTMEWAIIEEDMQDMQLTTPTVLTAPPNRDILHLSNVECTYCAATIPLSRWPAHRHTHHPPCNLCNQIILNPNNQRTTCVSGHVAHMHCLENYIAGGTSVLTGITASRYKCPCESCNERFLFEPTDAQYVDSEGLPAQTPYRSNVAQFRLEGLYLTGVLRDASNGRVLQAASYAQQYLSNHPGSLTLRFAAQGSQMEESGLSIIALRRHFTDWENEMTGAEADSCFHERSFWNVVM